MNRNDNERRGRRLPSGGRTAQNAQSPARQTGGKDRSAVLVVEDVLEVRDVIMRMLQRLGHDVIGAESGTEAVAAIERAPRVGLALIDLDLPGAVSGLEIAELVRRRAPDAATILISGFGEEPPPGDPATTGKRRGSVLRKPFTMNVLGEAVNRALQAKAPATRGAAATPRAAAPAFVPRKPGRPG